MGNTGESRISRRAKCTIGLCLLLCAPWTSVSVGDSSEELTPCEQRALQKYSEALRLCELAQDPNPRLRCYEAAKIVYLQALEECCKGDTLMTARDY